MLGRRAGLPSNQICACALREKQNVNQDLLLEHGEAMELQQEEKEPELKAPGFEWMQKSVQEQSVG